MTFIGMIFGANHAVTSLFIRKIEKQSLLKEIVAKGVVGLALLMALYIWSSGPLQYDRFHLLSHQVLLILVSLHPLQLGGSCPEIKINSLRCHARTFFLALWC
jgi:hypothetical protein